MAGAGLVPDRILVGLKFGTKTREVTTKGGAFCVLHSQMRVLSRRSLVKVRRNILRLMRRKGESREDCSAPLPQVPTRASASEESSLPGSQQIGGSSHFLLREAAWNIQTSAINLRSSTYHPVGIRVYGCRSGCIYYISCRTACHCTDCPQCINGACLDFACFRIHAAPWPTSCPYSLAPEL